MKIFFNTIHQRTEKHFFEITKKNNIRPVGCELCCIASNPVRILSWWPSRDPGWRVGGAGAGGRGRPPPAPVPAPSARGWGCSGPHSPRLYTPNIQCCRLWLLTPGQNKGKVCWSIEILCTLIYRPSFRGNKPKNARLRWVKTSVLGLFSRKLGL